MTASGRRLRSVWWFWLGLGLVLATGISARIYPSSSVKQIGYDEALYQKYVVELSHVGLANYPYIAERYLESQYERQIAILPPTRFLYIASAWLLHQASGIDALSSLRSVSCAFSILLLLLALLFSWRLGGRQTGLCVTALMSCAPTQIHMAQHALIDGVFAFWATLSLWLLWECLQQPRSWGWLFCYGLSLALLVITKENAVFAYVGLVILLIPNRYFKFGSVSPGLVAATLVGPLVGVALLVTLCGSIETVIHIYSLLVAKASVTPYAMITGDGPWYRYLFDLFAISPVILCLAIGGVFTLNRSNHAAIFLLSFVAASYVVMANIRYGMNLRYANMWDLPLRYLALGCLIHVGESMRRPIIWLGFAVVAICLIELRQYWVFFVQHDLYELTTPELLRAIRILK